MPKKDGITLIALIITIIVLVILAAVSISAVYNSNIIGFATNGAINYAEESKRENEILDQTASIMESAIGKIESINGGNTGSTEEPENPPVVEEPEVGINFGDMSEEEIENNYVGKYVDYTPDVGSFSDHVGSTYSGDEEGANVQLSTDINIKWKILFADNNTLTLISDKAGHSGFYLSGANGYNNGVLLLNNACKAMYSNNNLGTIGRSLNIDDIEKNMTYNKNNYSNYNTEYSTRNKYYPIIFAQEKTGAPNGIYGTRYGLSDQDEYVTETSIGNESFKGKSTYYTFTMSTSTMKNQTYVDIYRSSIQAWIASRCVSYNNSYSALSFRMFFIDNGTVDGVIWLYDSYNYRNHYRYAIRPIVEIDLTKVNVGLTGTGAENDGYSLTLK